MIPNSENKRVWFITGASKGLGYAFTCAALKAGDKVVAVARTIDNLAKLEATYQERLMPLNLDVKERSLWVCQAVMPDLRSQRSGHIIQITSIGAIISGPMSGIYSASKFALEGMSEALAKEAEHFGVKLTMVEPGGYWTDLYTSMSYSNPLDSYGTLRDELAKQYSEDSVDSDPSLAAEALMKLVASNNPPLRLILGSMVYDLAMDTLKARMATWEEWEAVSRASEKAIPAPERYGV